jgi:hypothetical protein
MDNGNVGTRTGDSLNWTGVEGGQEREARNTGRVALKLVYGIDASYGYP